MGIRRRVQVTAFPMYLQEQGKLTPFLLRQGDIVLGLAFQLDRVAVSWLALEYGFGEGVTEFVYIRVLVIVVEHPNPKVC